MIDCAPIDTVCQLSLDYAVTMVQVAENARIPPYVMFDMNDGKEIYIFNVDENYITIIKEKNDENDN